MLSRDDVISMAREAGFPFNKYGMLHGDEDGDIEADKMFERFYDLAVLHERESRRAAQLETNDLREELTKRAMQAENDAYRSGVRDEREACAELCKMIGNPYSGEKSEDLLFYADSGLGCAAAIRARNNKENKQ